MFATGYDVHLTGPPYPITGLGGRSLNDEWADGAQAYKSINAHGYPNLFFMTGPNSGPGHNSLLVYVEGQIQYAVSGITTILRDNLRYLDVREDVQRRYNRRIQQRLTKTTWMSGCSSWYLTKDGFNASMYPGFATQYLRQMRDFRFGDYGERNRSRGARRHPARGHVLGLRCLRPGSHDNPLGRSRRSSAVCAARPADPQGLPRRHRERGVAVVRRGRPTARCRRLRRVPHRGAGPAGGHHHPQHPGLPRPRPAASATAGGPDRPFQRHPPHPTAADHLPARPRLQHLSRARDVVGVGAGQGRRRHARAGDRRSPAAGPPRSPNG